jgi:hypothetical protein
MDGDSNAQTGIFCEFWTNFACFLLRIRRRRRNAMWTADRPHARMAATASLQRLTCTVQSLSVHYLKTLGAIGWIQYCSRLVGLDWLHVVQEQVAPKRRDFLAHACSRPHACIGPELGYLSGLSAAYPLANSKNGFMGKWRVNKFCIWHQYHRAIA